MLDTVDMCGHKLLVCCCWGIQWWKACTIPDIPYWSFCFPLTVIHCCCWLPLRFGMISPRVEQIYHICCHVLCIWQTICYCCATCLHWRKNWPVSLVRCVKNKWNVIQILLKLDEISTGDVFFARRKKSELLMLFEEYHIVAS